MPTYTKRFRIHILTLLRRGATPIELARKHGVSTTSIRRWRVESEIAAAERSIIMRSVKSHGTKLERKFAEMLAEHGLLLFEEQAHDLPGTPDFVFRKERFAIFIDSCFWHGCKHHHRKPKSNAAYWDPKIEGNRKRDRSRMRSLKNMGWHVERIWEHEVNEHVAIQKRLKKIADRLSQS